MSRRAIVVLLAGVNLLLLMAVLFTVHTPSAAMAQMAAGRGNDYALMSAEIETGSEVTYLLDSKTHRLYAFRTSSPRFIGETAHFALMAQRDLSGDFRRAQ